MKDCIYLLICLLLFSCSKEEGEPEFPVTLTAGFLEPIREAVMYIDGKKIEDGKLINQYLTKHTELKDIYSLPFKEKVTLTYFSEDKAVLSLDNKDTLSVFDRGKYLAFSSRKINRFSGSSEYEYCDSLMINNIYNSLFPLFLESREKFVEVLSGQGHFLRLEVPCVLFGYGLEYTWNNPMWPVRERLKYSGILLKPFKSSFTLRHEPDTLLLKEYRVIFTRR